MTILCLASYEKGHAFLRQCKRQGWTVVLVTSASIRETAHWPMDVIDEIFYLPEEDGRWNPSHLRNAVSYLARTRAPTRSSPLTISTSNSPPTSASTSASPAWATPPPLLFPHKLSMRLRAAEAGLNVPAFLHVRPHAALAYFLRLSPAPWILKPRSMAGAIGLQNSIRPHGTVAHPRRAR